MCHHIIENLIEPGLAECTATCKNPDNYNFEYLINYTNASYLLDPEFGFDVKSGHFSGWDEETKTYDVESWHYQTESVEEWDTSETGDYAWVNKPGTPVHQQAQVHGFGPEGMVRRPRHGGQRLRI